MNKLKLVCVAAISMLFIIGCVTAQPTKRVTKEILTTNISEKAPDSMEFLVTDFKWTYFNEGTHLKVSGAVLNATGAPKQSVILTAQLYDGRGNMIAQGFSYVAPTYLAPGGEGSFEFVAMPKHSKMKHARLVYSCKSTF